MRLPSAFKSPGSEAVTSAMTEMAYTVRCYVPTSVSTGTGSREGVYCDSAESALPEEGQWAEAVYQGQLSSCVLLPRTLVVANAEYTTLAANS